MLPKNKECRQGSILTRESAILLGLIDTESADEFCVVITHDCDIYNDKEPQVECIIATKPVKVNPSFSCAANPRRLNLNYTSNDSEPMTLELAHVERKVISRAQFLKEGKVAANYGLTMQEKRTLKMWLAARYGRSAFPGHFEERLRNGNDFEKKIRRILQPNQVHIIGVFFFLGSDRFNELPSGMPYCLTITIAYDGIGGPIARKTAEECTKKITELFHETYGAPEIAKEIALENCQAVSDMDFSLADIRNSDQWRVDSISLQEPFSELLLIGQAPA